MPVKDMSGARTHTGDNLPTANTINENGLRAIYLGNGHQLSYQNAELVAVVYRMV